MLWLTDERQRRKEQRFVDLPDEDTRQEVFRIHLESRGHDSQRYDVASLAAEADGFSGSEIETVRTADAPHSAMSASTW